MDEKPFGGKFGFISFNLAYPQKDIKIIRNCTEDINCNLYAESIDTWRLNSFGGKFGFIRFNLSSTRRSIAIVRNCAEELKADIHIGNINHFNRTANEELLLKCTLVNSILTARTMSDTLYTKHNLISLLPSSREALELFASNHNLKALIPIERIISETAKSHSFIKAYTLKSFGGRFGFIRFNLAVVEKDIPIVRTCSERIYSTIGIGMLSHTYRLMSEGINGKVEAKISYLTSRNPSEKLMQSSIVLVRVISLRSAMQEIHNNSYVSKAIHSEREAIDNLTGLQFVGKRIHTNPILAIEKINGNVTISKNLSFNRMVTEALLCITEASLTEYYIASFDVSLPPGGELHINSNNFTAWLDGSNALDSHSGHWVMLNRNIVELTVDSGTGGDLKGEIIYTERYI